MYIVTGLSPTNESESAMKKIGLSIDICPFTVGLFWTNGALTGLFPGVANASSHPVPDEKYENPIPAAGFSANSISVLV